MWNFDNYLLCKSRESGFRFGIDGEQFADN